MQPIRESPAWSNVHLCAQKQVARTEQEILNQIKEKEIHVTQLKRKLEQVKVSYY